MKYKLLVLLLVITLVIPLSTAATIGTFKQGEVIEIYQICENCTYNNISVVLYPNSTVAVSNVIMSKDDTYYNYTFSNTDILGKYIVNGFGDINGVKTSWVYDFEITGTGFEFTQSRSNYYIGLLALLVFFFIITIIAIPRIPDGNVTDDYGMLMDINNLKYLKPVLWITAWVILLGIVFTSSNVALAYLGSEMFGQLLFTIYRIMFLITLPGIIIWTIYILISIFRDKEVKKMIERGVEIPGI